MRVKVGTQGKLVQCGWMRMWSAVSEISLGDALASKLPWRLAHGLLRCTFAPLEGSRACGLTPQWLRKPEAKDSLFPPPLPPTSSLGWRRKDLRKGVPCPYLSPLPHSLPDLVPVYRAGPVSNSLSPLTKSSLLPGSWPLASLQGRGGCRGRRWEGTGLILGMWRPAGSCPKREGTCH